MKNIKAVSIHNEIRKMSDAYIKGARNKYHDAMVGDMVLYREFYAKLAMGKYHEAYKILRKMDTAARELVPVHMQDVCEEVVFQH